MTCCGKRIKNTEKRIKRNKVNPYKQEETKKELKENKELEEKNKE